MQASDPLQAIGCTTLLSAGPGAGKTRRMGELLRNAPGLAMYLALSPDDRDPAHLLRRLLRAWPRELPALEGRADWTDSWGERLAQAMTEAAPLLAVLLDDLHHLEGSLAESELLAFVRAFSPRGTLMLASRHRLPPISRPHLQLYDTEDPGWRENPEPRHLFELPIELQALVLALYLVVDLPPTPEALELVRRNLAHQGPDERIALRPAWAPALQKAFSHPWPAELVDRLDELLLQHHLDGLRTRRQRHCAARLRTLPAGLRHARPVFLLIEGQALYDQGDFREARAHFEQALRLAPPDSPLELDLQILLAQIRYELEPAGPPLEQLPDWLARANLRQQAALLNHAGLLHWKRGDRQAARDLWQQVLDLPIFEQSNVAVEHAFALKELAGLLSQGGGFIEALPLAERRLRLVREHALSHDLLSAHLSLLEIRAAGAPIPLENLLSIPSEGFRDGGRLAMCQYLTALAIRASQLGAWEHAASVSTILLQHATTVSATAFVSLANLLLLLAQARLGVPETEARYHYLASQKPFGWSRSNQRLMQAIWVSFLWDHDRRPEARALLAALRESGSEPATDRVLRIFQDGLEGRYLAGLSESDHEALRRQLAADPLGEAIGTLLGDRLPGGRLPPTRLQVFGPLSLRRGSVEALAGGAPKPLLLLANLVRVPGGLSSRELARRIFRRDGAMESLHSAAYGLRRLLQGVGLQDLLISGHGGYRLDWMRIDFCDLGEFDLLLEKAVALRDDGCSMAAALHARVALALVRGPVFENLDESLDQTRSHYRNQIRLAEELARLTES